jgi:4-hydroxy-4-methyl-2-oxoglutarate aldolase
MIHAAVEVLEQGDILVVTTSAPSVHGMFGELLATSVAAHGCRGLIIDAGVRDTADLRSMGFPVWARAVNVAGTTKEAAGTVNLPVSLAGVLVGPGDVVVADDDGVAIVERLQAEAVLEAARRRLAKEEATRARLAAGELGVDLYGFRRRLEEMGVRWVENADE